jgi:GDP-L-fucose synthase
MYADDLAEACVFLMKDYNEKLFINVGTGEEITIGDLARLIGEVVGYEGEITFDKTKPDGTPRKLMDNSRLRALGWSHRTKLKEGLGMTYPLFLKSI